MLNLALPGRAFYANQLPYSHSEYERKIEWIGQQLIRLNADIIACQEIWDETALRATVASSRLRYQTIMAPGAETGATGTPRNGLITRLQLESLETLYEFPSGMSVPVPELGDHGRFERPIRGSHRLHQPRPGQNTPWRRNNRHSWQSLPSPDR